MLARTAVRKLSSNKAMETPIVAARGAVNSAGSTQATSASERRFIRKILEPALDQRRLRADLQLRSVAACSSAAARKSKRRAGDAIGGGNDAADRMTLGVSFVSVQGALTGNAPMRYLPLVWSGIWRKPGRTILIFLQVAVAFALFGVLQGLKTGVEELIASARGDILIVHSRLSSIADALPLGLIDQIRTVPGVKAVIPVELAGATYQKPTERMILV